MAIEDIQILTILPEWVDEDIGHMQNNHHPTAFENGRRSLFKSMDLGTAKLIAERGIALVVASANYTYLQEVQIEEQVAIHTTLYPYTDGLRLKILQEMRRKDQVLSTAKTEYVSKNLERGTPVRGLIQELVDQGILIKDKEKYQES